MRAGGRGLAGHRGTDAEEKGDEVTNYCYCFYVLFLYIICYI